MEHQIPITHMEQEQPVSKPVDQKEIPDPMREIGEKVAATFKEFKESPTYEKIIEGKEQVRDYIRNNPLVSFGYAMGAGLLLGLILKKNK